MKTIAITDTLSIVPELIAGVKYSENYGVDILPIMCSEWLLLYRDDPDYVNNPVKTNQEVYELILEALNENGS